MRTGFDEPAVVGEQDRSQEEGIRIFIGARG